MFKWWCVFLLLGTLFAKEMRADEFGDLPIDSQGLFGFSRENTLDPGAGLSPEEKFHRVPLRPAMSDLNWSKWAGPTLNKIYRIHRGESLWLISQRLFGNPHLWPKVWQLNANIGNAHFVSPGMELQFQPGNPNEAPKLAWVGVKSGDYELFPLSPPSAPRVSSMGDISKRFFRFSEKGDPLVKNFFRKKLPQMKGAIPAHKRGSIGMYKEGDFFELPYLEEGKYSIVRTKMVDGVQLVQLLGYADAKRWRPSDRKNVYIDKAYFEIYQDDLILEELFLQKNFPIRSVKLGRRSREKAQLLIQYNEAQELGASMMTLGVEFRYKHRDYLPGSIFEVLDEGDEFIGRAVLVDKKENLGTLYVLESLKDITHKSYLR